MTNDQKETKEQFQVSELSGVDGSHLEKMYVYDAYDQIAPYFVNIQHKAWPHVRQFLKELEPGSLVADIGCGNGRYLGINSTVYMVGCDRCKGMIDIANQRGFETAIADNLRIPYRDGMFDGAISVAVIHHFVTIERRIQAIKELARIVQPGGKLMIYVWAFEQKYRKFESSDVLVPWFHQLRNKSESMEKKGRRSSSGQEGEGGRRRSSRSSAKSSQRRKSGRKSGDSFTSTSHSSGNSKSCSLDKTGGIVNDACVEEKCDSGVKDKESGVNISSENSTNFTHNISMHTGDGRDNINDPKLYTSNGENKHEAAAMEDLITSQSVVTTTALQPSGSLCHSQAMPTSACHKQFGTTDTVTKLGKYATESVENPPLGHTETSDIVAQLHRHDSPVVAQLRHRIDDAVANDDPVWVLRDDATSSRTSFTYPTVISASRSNATSIRPSSLNLDLESDYNVSIRSHRYYSKDDKRNACLKRCTDCLCTSTFSPSESVPSIAEFHTEPREFIEMETSLGSQQLSELMRVNRLDSDDGEMLSKPAFAAGIKDTLLTWFGKKSRTLDSGSSVNENIGSSTDLRRSLSWKEYYQRFLRDNSRLYANVDQSGVPLVESRASMSDACYDNVEFAVRQFPLSSCPRDWTNNMSRDLTAVDTIMPNNLTNSQDFSGEIDDTTSPLSRKFSSIKSTCNRVQNSLRSASKMSLNSDKSSSYKGPYYHVLEDRPRTSSESDSYQYNNTGGSLFDGFVYNCSTSNSTSYDDSGNLIHKHNTTESDSSGSASTVPKFRSAKTVNKSALIKNAGYAEAKIVDFNAVKSVNISNDGNHLLNVKRNKNGYHKLSTIQDEQIQEVSKIARINSSFNFSDGKNPCAYEVKKINSRSSTNIDAVTVVQNSDGNVAENRNERRQIPTVNVVDSTPDSADKLEGNCLSVCVDKSDSTNIDNSADSCKITGTCDIKIDSQEPQLPHRDNVVLTQNESNSANQSSVSDYISCATNNINCSTNNIGCSTNNIGCAANNIGCAPCAANNIGCETNNVGSTANNIGANHENIPHKQSTSPDKNGVKHGAVSCQRYYHVFKQGELKKLIEDHVPSLHIIKTFYDHANWCVVAEKVTLWNV